MSSSSAKVTGETIANKVAGAAAGARIRASRAAKKAGNGPSKGGNKKAAPLTSSASIRDQLDNLAGKNFPKKVSRNSDDVIENAPRHMVLGLYKELLKRSRQLKYTDHEFFARRMHQEFMKRKDVKDNNLYYIRGKWMLVNNMGGLL